ncbi:MAG TPA: hypothetical protein VMD02_00740 [Candidatus Omnitrophota bacterium]|nr:hypothetical protein [Candidatus Omnitrophota bacterium]
MPGPVENSRSRPKVNLSMGLIVRRATDDMNSPYGNTTIESKDRQGDRTTEKVATGTEVGVYGELQLTWPVGIGVGYRAGMLTATDLDYLDSADPRTMAITNRDKTLENTLLLSWTPVGAIGDSPYTLRMGAGPTLASVFYKTTDFTFGEDPSLQKGSTVKNKFGVTGAVDGNLKLFEFVDLTAGISASSFGPAGTVLGMNAGVSLEF